MEPQIIRTGSGEELVVLPRAEYDRLRQAATGPAAEVAADIAAADAARAALADGSAVTLPIDVATAILDGTPRLRAIRKWRRLTQAEMAARAGVTQSVVSVLERGETQGAPDTWRSLARALEVPVGVLLGD